MATKKAAEDTALEKKQDASMVVAPDYGDDAGQGYQGQTSADVRIPIINLLQDLSPMVKARKANPGDWYNTVTEQIWPADEGFLFVPCLTRHVFVEWVPRDKGGGYRGQFKPEDPIVLNAIAEAKKDPDLKFGEYYVGENELAETFYVFGVLCTEDGQADSMALIPFTSTKIRPYKGWMTRLRQALILDAQGKRVRPPLYAHLTRIKSTMTRNTEGEFAVPVITSGDPRGITQSLLPRTDERFMMAKEMMVQVDSGALESKIDYNQTRPEGETKKEGDVPF